MYCILMLQNNLMMPIFHVKTKVKRTTCLCSVALFQADIDLHDRHMLDLNLQPKAGLEQDVKG